MREKLSLVSIMIPLILSILSVNIIGIAAAETHDVAVVSVKPSSTSVKLGELVNITVVVENQGTEPETFNVTTYYDNTTIETKTVQNLGAGANTTLTFTWNTTIAWREIYSSAGHRKTYEIKAIASTVPGETDTEDNTQVSHSRVYVFVPHYIAVVPQNTVNPNLTIGMNYIVSIYTDYNGTDIWGWEFTLTYNPLVLHGISVTNGDLIVNGTGEEDTGAMFIPGNFNNTEGRLSLTTAFFYYFMPPSNVTSGPGILANITFQVVGEGDSYIKLGTSVMEGITKLVGITEDGYGDPYNIIDDIIPEPGHILRGYFKNTLEEVTHDIAVVSVTPSLTLVEVGDLVNITVVVKNNGTVKERFEVSVWYGEVWEIDTKLVEALEAGANMSLTFTWDTTGVPTETYTIKAEADPNHKIYESNKDNNIMTAEWGIEVVPEFPTLMSLLLVLAILAVSIMVLKRKKQQSFDK